MKFYNYLHANQGEPPEPVICEFCDKFFVNEEDLKIHMIIHDAERIDEEEKEVICDKCCKIFDSMKDLDIHIKDVHENERITKIQTPQKQQELSVKRQALLHSVCFISNVYKQRCLGLDEFLKKISNRLVFFKNS